MEADFLTKPTRTFTSGRGGSATQSCHVDEDQQENQTNQTRPGSEVYR